MYKLRLCNLPQIMITKISPASDNTNDLLNIIQHNYTNNSILNNVLCNAILTYVIYALSI